MRNDFISSKERLKLNKFDLGIVPVNPLDAAINTIQAAQFNKNIKEDDASQVCIKKAIELLEMMLH